MEFLGFAFFFFFLEWRGGTEGYVCMYGGTGTPRGLPFSHVNAPPRTAPLPCLSWLPFGPDFRTSTSIFDVNGYFVFVFGIDMVISFLALFFFPQCTSGRCATHRSRKRGIELGWTVGSDQIGSQCNTKYVVIQ